jgi:hypothetical protein
LRLRKDALDSLIPLEAENVFRRYKPERCWTKDGHVFLTETSLLNVMPLLDPDLFLSFVRLGARRGGEYRDPTEAKIRKWVGTYGLPAKSKSLPRRGKPEAPASMPVEKFRREVRDARELWTIHKEIWASDAKAIKRRIKKPHSRWDDELVEGLDSRDHMLARSVLNADEAILHTAHGVLGTITTSKIMDVRPRLHGYGLSWWCPDLISALYLQFALLITGDRPKRICENCGTLFPLTRKDKYHCNESCYRTAYNHREA